MKEVSPIEFDSFSHTVEDLRRRIDNYRPSAEHQHDRHMLVAVSEALAAACEGNFGIGACLVDASGQVVERGHNHVYHPYLRTDLHAEMDTITRYEERCRTGASLRDFTLFSSLEPCPMCLTRLILAGVGQVYHAVDDPSGGMVYRLSHFTPEWLVLSARQTFAEADISSELKSIARQVFLLMADISIAQMREHSCSEVAG